MWISIPTVSAGPYREPRWRTGSPVKKTSKNPSSDLNKEGNHMPHNLVLKPTVTFMGGTEGECDALRDRMELDPCSTPGEDLAEFAGRACYQSFHKPNPDTKDNEDYLANIIAQGHESVLEHVQASFYIEGVSRTLTHELVRHRHLSYSQLSQRYVDESEAKFVVPPRYLEDEQMMNFFSDYQKEVTQLYSVMVKELSEKGVPRKKAREAARSVLPNSTETKIVVSGNCRAWRDFLKKRMHPAADAEIQRLAVVLFDELMIQLPSIFTDLTPLREALDD